MFAWLFGGMALAQDPVAEEIIVWGDPFLRWEQRWYVETEIHHLLFLLGWRNKQLRMSAVQIRAVIDCEKDLPQGKQQWIVECVVEDVGLVARTRKREVARSLAVIEEVDATLTGATFQLHAHASGRVPHVDLEGLTTTTRATRVRQEAMRQLALRTIVPFNLKLPETVYDGVKWYEYGNWLMTMPATILPPIGAGEKKRTIQLHNTSGSIVTHVMSKARDQLVVQSIGKATIRQDAVSEDFPRYVAVRMHGVALFEPETGIMTERVWTVHGEATASSGNALSAPGYKHVGRLRMLGEKDRPQVGTTRTVSAEDWVPLEP